MEAKTRASSSGGAPGNFHPAQIDFPQVLGQSVALHGQAIGAERVGQNDLAARLHVSARHFFHAVRVRQVPMVGAFAGFQAARLEFRPPSAVGEDGALRYELLELKCAYHCRFSIADFRLTVRRCRWMIAD